MEWTGLNELREKYLSFFEDVYKRQLQNRVPRVRILLPLPYGPVVQLVRTLACHARGREFEPCLLYTSRCV